MCSANIIKTQVLKQDVSYTISIFSDLIQNPRKYQSTFSHAKALIITTPSVYKYYRHFINELKTIYVECRIKILEITENTKNIKMVEDVCKAAYEMQLGKNDVFVSVSGGCCQDVITVAASLYKRGIGVIRIPTTMIGIVDASVGIKASMNFLTMKSSLGLFHPPKTVLIDLNFLKTLPLEHIQCGVAEIIKIAVVLDQPLFELLERNSRSLIVNDFYINNEPEAQEIIQLAIRGMLSQLEENFYEDKTFERLVDFGHTFSNVIESDSDWSVSHGFAVAIDIAISSYIAFKFEKISHSELQRIINMLLSVGLPITSEFLTVDSCIRAIEKAKLHRGGDINCVIPNRIGRGYFIKQDNDVLLSAIHDGILFLRSYKYENQSLLMSA
jgi:3-dehydroquinate synthetase